MPLAGCTVPFTELMSCAAAEVEEVDDEAIWMRVCGVTRFDHYFKACV